MYTRGMEHIWLKPTHKEEAEKLAGIEDISLETVNTAETPVKEVLSQDLQRNLEHRFPKTSDDTLQEDAARKLVTDSHYLERLHQGEVSGEQVAQDITSSLKGMYQKTREAGEYLEVYKEVNPKVSELLHNLQLLELDTKYAKLFPKERSETSNKEAYMLLQEEIERIKDQLNKIRDKEISRESVGELVEKYNMLTEKYTAILNLIEPKNPQLN